jgi:hypothetical protein
MTGISAAANQSGASKDQTEVTSPSVSEADAATMGTTGETSPSATAAATTVADSQAGGDADLASATTKTGPSTDEIGMASPPTVPTSLETTIDIMGDTSGMSAPASAHFTDAAYSQSSHGGQTSAPDRTGRFDADDSAASRGSIVDQTANMGHKGHAAAISRRRKADGDGSTQGRRRRDRETG